MIIRSISPNRDNFLAITTENINVDPSYTQLANYIIPDGFAVVLKSPQTNVGTIYYSNSATNITSSSTRSLLRPGESVSLYISNTNLIYVSGSVSGLDIEIIVEQ